jgi:hypothetical protein
MFFQDLVFETQAQEIAFENTERSDKRCSHCHRWIYGKVNQQGAKYYDSYCWQFRFINKDAVSDEKARNSDLRTQLELREGP